MDGSPTTEPKKTIPPAPEEVTMGKDDDRQSDREAIERERQRDAERARRERERNAPPEDERNR
jgi:hypothetical protein